MAMQPKILLLDDEEEFLDLYQEMLSQHLPSSPLVKIATSGARALSMLESEPFNLLSVDLNMPKMDGLQVLSIARKKYPQLRLVVLTGIRDEEFRIRAYAMGVDQYWIKPDCEQEMGLLMESFESLVNQEIEGGFRGIQSKSLVDIIQLECLSNSSSMLRINTRAQEGKIWIHHGEVIDAEAGELTAESAFQKILTWKTGSFETLPSDPDRPHTIFTSYQGLLLNTAQAMDEARAVPKTGQDQGGGGIDSPVAATISETAPLLAELSQIPGLEFIVAKKNDLNGAADFWGLEDPESTVKWAAATLKDLKGLADQLQVGQLQHAIGTTLNRKVALASAGDTDFCVGFAGTLRAEYFKDILKNILTKWES